MKIMRMKTICPSRNVTILRSMLGRTIIAVKRYLFEGDMYRENYQQSADGAVEISLDNGCSVHFVAEPETFSVGVMTGPMPRYGESYVLADVTDNSFWHSRVGQKIDWIRIHKAPSGTEECPEEFGLCFFLSNQESICIEYFDEQDYFDSIRVVAKHAERASVVEDLT